MREDLVFATIKQILAESQNEENISLAAEPNRLADIMIYKQAGRPDYLALDGRPIVPLSSIDNILYRYGENESYNHVGTFLQLVFELEGDADYILEFGDDSLIELMKYKGEWYEEDRSNSKLKDALANYNQEREKRNCVMNLFYFVQSAIERNNTVPEDEVEGVNAAVWQYLKDNSTDYDFLYSFALTVMQVLTYEKVDPFNAREVIKLVVERNAADGLIKYIENEWADFENSSENGYYLTLITNTLRFIREVSEKMPQ